ncbi:Pyridoxal phosphate-dependent transferase [Gracilaria domingensis]|nr:Pyridoxal phosphate-dependent transferase [Gracilaria domingensis]
MGSTEGLAGPLVDYECTAIAAAPSVGQLNPPHRLLCGPGPGNAHPRVHAAMSLPEIGHLDPAFISMMEDIKALLRYAWQTNNEFTIPVSGTGSAAMEACMANLISAGDKVLIGCNGYFGLRLADMASRYGGEVVKMARPWGTVFSFEEIKAAIEEHKPVIVALVHAETSTGAAQPLEGVGDLCHDNGALLVADCVTSISGVPCHLDKWGVDAAYAGTQKCLSCPPGVAPLSFSKRAMDKLMAREDKVKNWYLDMKMVASYLVGGKGASRSYHHTAPISMCYAIREALTIVAEEGLETRWARHREVAEAFWAGLEEIGLECLVAKEHRLPSLTTVKVPDGVDPKAVTKHFLEKYQIEIGNGLGELAGKVWRIGLMGYNSRMDNVAVLLACFKDALKQQGFGS